ncbi:MAG: NUDIX hydrolase [Clostridia bacterium]|nr:NUDIX hydrolase [Clostridia bacterium]
MDMTEKKISEKLIYDGRIIHLYVDEIELPNGKPAMREYIRHQGAVCVVPVTEDGKVIVVDQFRYPFGRVTTEIPAGKIDPGEDPETAARRELSEETGIEDGELTFIGEFYSSPAILTEIIYMYTVKNFTRGELHTDPDEFVEVREIPLDELVEDILAGRIKDSKTQAAVLKTAMLRSSEA